MTGRVTTGLAHLSAGVVEGGGLQVVDGVDRRVSRHEHTHDVEVALLASPVKRRVVVSVALVDISVVVDVLQQCIQIALHARESTRLVHT